MSLREQLQTVYDDNGRLTPELVVQTATPKSHPLHSRFDWDNREAGHKWRLHQADTLIRSVKSVYRKPDSEQTLEIRTWQAVRKDNSYEPVEKVVADPLLRAIAIHDMEREWKQLKARYSDFEEFWSLVKSDLAVAA